MNGVIEAIICETPVTLMLQGGFFNHVTHPSPPHKHRYCEIHAVYGGEIGYTVENVTYRLGSGGLLMIPAEVKHTCDEVLEGAVHCSFLIDAKPSRTVFASVPPAVIDRLTRAAKMAEARGNYREAVGCISFLLSVLFEDWQIDAKPLRNDALIISDYIEKNYANSPSLEALASDLRLSVKQTARLVLRYMGSSFWEEITKRRMETAEQLLLSGRMTNREVGEYVGYRSYSGFYKAWERYKQGK